MTVRALPTPAARLARLALVAVVAALAAAAASAAPTGLPHPVMFVSQVPIAADFATIGSTFANHLPGVGSVGRGGDLHVVYPDGTLRNLTREAGFGVAGTFQGAGSIAVRDPTVHWSGTKAVFSMVIGAATEQFEQVETYWQLYEVTGLGQGDAAVVTKVPNQPADYNNVSPIYASDDRILFTSDRPRSGERHLWPQHDEYESTATVTGLWSLDPASGELFLMDHAPSGVFTPEVDSFGRVIFTRWDHLQRDQQADADADEDTFGTFDYADESAGAAKLDQRVEVFPEPRAERTDLLAGTNLVGLRFNHFFPWQIFQDGTEPETLNHIGRHELHEFFTRVFDDDPELEDFVDEISGRINPNPIENLFHVTEDPNEPGRYLGIDAPEFDTHGSGQLVALEAPPSTDADHILVEYLTPRATKFADTTPDPEHTGHYRDPMVATDGTVVVAHTFQTGGAATPYDFRLRKLVVGGGGFLAPGAALTPGIARTLEWWSPDVLVTFSGTMWEMSPVPVVARTVPPAPTAALPTPEQQVFVEEGVDVAAFQADLAERGLALLVSRDVTTRDDADEQQPYNLRVPGGHTTVDGDGEIYDVAFLQMFQGDQVRGRGGIGSPSAGRRVLARVLHDPEATNPAPAGAPDGAVAIAPDGSVAALVPSRRAMTWQLTAADGTPVVRERYWLTFQPGEIRVCASCHGVNDADQAGAEPPENPPQALRQLLQLWSSHIFADGFESGDTSAW